MSKQSSMTRYVLPDLAYDYSALEPHISGRVLQLHHDKHHRAYVDGANRALEKILEMRDREEFDRIASVEHELAFNISGHVLHSLFWQNLSPDGGDKPTGDLLRCLTRDFGSFELFKKQLCEVARTIMG